MASFLNTQLPIKLSGLNPQSASADAPQRPKLSLNGFSPHFPVVLGIDKRTPGVDPMGMSMNTVPTAKKGCFNRDERSGITTMGNQTVSTVLNPVVDTFHSKTMNASYQSRGLFLGEKPGLDIKVKLTC